MDNHALRNISFSNREITHIFLSHLNESRYASDNRKCKNEILYDMHINCICLVPDIAGTIDQISPISSTPGAQTNATTIHLKRHREARIQQLTDFFKRWQDHCRFCVWLRWRHRRTTLDPLYSLRWWKDPIWSFWFSTQTSPPQILWRTGWYYQLGQII